MSYVHPFSKRCDKSEIDLFSVPPTQQSLERGRWIDYAPLSSVENPDSAITYLIAGADEYSVLHRDGDLPAVISARGDLEYWKNGRRHRDNGPAVIRKNGVCSWYKNGVHLETC